MDHQHTDFSDFDSTRITNEFENEFIVILKHLQNLQIGTDPWKVINKLLDFRVKCCEGAKFHYFPIFFVNFFFLFFLI